MIYKKKIEDNIVWRFVNEESKEKNFICVLGEPKGKARPRFNSKTKVAYTPSETKEMENLIKLKYIRKFGSTPIEGGIKLTVRAFFGIAKSKSKKLQEEMIMDKIRPIKRPDIDNIVKLVADSLNGVAYADDNQIVEIIASKHYSTKARTEIKIERVGEC